jgi:choline/glycine/proline betaine transport protein
MLFAAGMGIGLMFFGVAEPVMHFTAPPTADPSSLEAAKEALKTTFFHWGLHAWAIYAAVALILAYFSFRQGLPLTLRSALYPLIGDKIYGWPGHIVDIFAVIGTVFGVATSLGIGASQINFGLAHLLDIPVSDGVQLALMAMVTCFAIISVASGLDRGIRILSEINMALAVGLLLCVLILGPTVFLLQAYIQNMGAYLSDIVRNTFNLFAYEKTDWIGGWTIFYWGWWLAWSPFVGIFIARISRGRSIREFVLGVLLIPTGFTLMWMTFFGNTAIDFILNGGQETIATVVGENASVALFVFLQQFPFSDIFIVVAIAMIIVFFVTSCDSGAMVVDMLCSYGNNDTPKWQRIFWAALVGVVAAVLMASGGLNALQTMTIAAAFPFAIILLISLVSLVKALRVEHLKRESLQTSLVPLQTSDISAGWKERLQNIVAVPNRTTVERFVKTVVRPAMEAVVVELKENQITAEVIDHPRGIKLQVNHGEQHDFVYAVYRRKHAQPEFLNLDEEVVDNNDDQTYYRAEVHLLEGGQDYDIMGWSKLAVINDVIDQYHKHMHFLHLLR